MNEVLDSTPATPPGSGDLMTAARRVLSASEEPLTLSKIRSHLPTAFRTVKLEELEANLDRLSNANVVYRYPAYRSPHARFWDRPMPEHIAVLVAGLLEAEGPLPAAQIRRKLPEYARAQAIEVLDEQLAQGRLHRHPAGGRSGERLGLTPPDPRTYLRQELPVLFAKLERDLGFTRAQLREAAIELLHEEEWDAPPVQPASAQPAEVPAAPPVVEPASPPPDMPAVAQGTPAAVAQVEQQPEDVPV